jgi:hypothetical protein
VREIERKKRLEGEARKREKREAKKARICNERERER